MFFEDVPNDAPLFADGGEVAEGRRPDVDDGMLSLSRPGRLAPFLQWSAVASAGGQMLAKAFQAKTFAAGGEVAEEHGPVSSDGGFLSTSRAGSLFPFLQWHNWYNIYKNTRDQVTAAGGEAAVAAIVGAVTGPAGAAATAAATTLTNTAGAVIEQFSTQAEALRRFTPLPMASQPQLRTLEGRLGSGLDIDRSTTINVIKAGSYGPATSKDALNLRALTYLSHVR
ncbi:hypothetical protein SAMN04244553_4539 [Nocardia amikacinitolerans]|uniref:Uncharacterized protein n=1 Tax=Nocardia amikacinitolerans TaxID=756689 RepID=A0A285LW72_9NOCA|nr:hypothetical protein [Nocardia amikacinitolerans]MCP2276456.1 hypothetical protein [Nocardia amikacinitolerans]MCP2295163.1 hypothetical protein [Nocardia amikacinitolerans]SNY87591.1 hypothetical protein SAMN04244553_4539 [Nocardia amikacinitolerans]